MALLLCPLASDLLRLLMTLIGNWQQHVVAAAAAVALTFQNDCNELHTTALAATAAPALARVTATFHKNNAKLTTNQCNYHAVVHRAPKQQLAKAKKKKKTHRRRIKHASCLCQGCCWLLAAAIVRVRDRATVGATAMAMASMA